MYTKPKIKIAIVEDNEGFRKSLIIGLNTFEEFTIIHQLPNALNIEEAFNKDIPDVVLMDINMPGIEGIEAVKIIDEKFPNTNCIILTVFEDLDKVIKSMQNGAKGYLIKNKDNIDTIAKSIKIIYNGQYDEEFPLSSRLAKKIMNHFKEKEKTIDEKLDQYLLTTRQKEILICLYNGKTYKEIANEFYISIETIYSHVKNIYPKLNINSRHQIKNILN